MLAALIAFFWRRPAALPLTFMAVLLGDGISTGLKHVFDRVRPSDRYTEPETLMHVAHTPSFPSGHATTSFACAALLARFLPRAAAALYILAALIAWSRVYVGAHYPLDTLAGAALGLVIATALRRLPQVLRRLLPPRRPS